MKKIEKDYSHINGWGIDHDSGNMPAYPMKQRTETDKMGMIWERPAQQPETTEVLHSIERPGLSAVFGTPNPPTGLSGQIRRFAFKYSESHMLHWFPLLLADRIQMCEALGEDIKSGHIPDIFSELGGRSELKHNASGFAKKALCGVAAVVLLVICIKRK
jgi:hypothetical protein